MEHPLGRRRGVEDLLVVQQLPPLKPDLRPDRGKDKAYLLDPGWSACWRNVLDHTQVVGRPEMGALMETVTLDHLRRLRYNLLHTTAAAIGYVREPEVDACVQLGRRWLLVEVKAGGRGAERLMQVGGPEDLRIVVAGSRSDLAGPDVWTIPAHEFALLC